jgi:hypothetical protein
MQSAQTNSARSQVEALLPFASEKAGAFRGEISLSGPNTYLRRVAAANLFRVPRCLKAILLLADAQLSLEANTICRTLVDLAIESCWMGTDEDRAGLVWNSFVVDQQRGIVRFGEFTKTMSPVSQADKQKLNSIPVPRNLAASADAAIDTLDFPARRIARMLYHLLYDPLSTSSHGDLRDAVTIVQWNKEADLIEEALSIAIYAAVPLLCATSLQLGFRPDVEAFLDARGIQNPFSRPSPPAAP